MNLKVSPQAAADIRTANAWWRVNRPAAPELLTEEIRRAFRLLVAQPLSGAQVPNTVSEGIRSLYLRGTRYCLYYSTTVEDIEVLRLWHASRGTKPRL